MKAKLIKDNDGYWLDISDDGITKRPLTDFGQLSIKNCQAIENGYDLDELAEEWCMKPENNWSNNNNEVGDNYGSYKEGFQKALEIIGDKKFNRQDVIHALTYGVREAKTGRNHSQILEEYRDVHLQQQTEWDVEVETEPYVKYVSRTGNTIYPPLGIQNKLDADGCLILKRI